MKSIVATVVLAGCLVLVGDEGSAKDVKGKDAAGVPGLSHLEIFRRSAGDQSGDIFLLTQRGNILVEERNFIADGFFPSHITTEDAKTGQRSTRVIPPHPITTHGYAWDYDLEIPLTFWEPAPKRLKRGTYKELAIQQDIAPTLARVLNIAAPAKSAGRALAEALAKVDGGKIAAPPKAIVIFVQDQVGMGYLKAHGGRAPFIAKLMKQGANFTHAAVSHVDVETSVGHAAVSTGAFPPQNGISANYQFQTGSWAMVPAFTLPQANGKFQEGWAGAFLAPTLSDTWLKATRGASKVLSLAMAARASIAMGGHGALMKGVGQPHVIWAEERGPEAGRYLTDPEVYSSPQAVTKHQLGSYMEKFLADRNGNWLDHKLTDPQGKPNYDVVKGTPIMPAYESAILLDAIAELQIGKDDVTDLVWVNMKATDYCGHMFGYESDECGDVLGATDAAIERIVNALQEATGGDLLTVFTADHGCAPLPELSGGLRLSRQDLLKGINKKFDRKDNNIDVAQSATSSQLYINRKELEFNGHTLKEVATYLRNLEAPMTAPGNMLADEWKKTRGGKGKKFFFEVVERDTLRQK